MSQFLKKSMILLLPLLLCCGAGFAQVAPPPTVNFQGRLTDLSNNPLNGTYEISFSLYSAASNGLLLWTERQSAVEVVNGAVEVVLGSVTPIPHAVASSPAAFLEIQVETETLTPRQPFASVLYAMNSARLAGRTFDVFVDTFTAQTIGGLKTFGTLIATGPVTAQKYYGDGSGLTGIVGDSLGDHTAIASLDMAGNSIINISSLTVSGGVLAQYFVGNGSGLSGISGDNLGSHIAGTALDMANYPVNNVSTLSVTNSVTAARYYGDGSGLSGISGDNLGNHTATANLNMASRSIVSVATVTAWHFVGDGAGLTGIAGDNLGNHTATMPLNMAGHSIVNISSMALTGLQLTGSLRVADGTQGAGKVLTSDSGGFASWQPAAGADNLGSHTAAMALNMSGFAIDSVSSMTVAGTLIAGNFVGDGSGLSNIVAQGDGLGSHTASQALDMGNYAIRSSSDITALAYQINGAAVLSILNPSGSLAVGPNAGLVNGGDYGVFVGKDAGKAATGMGNTFVGYETGGNNTSGSINTFLGFQAGYSNITGANSTFVGNSAGHQGISGVGNSFFGVQSGYNNISGWNNSSFGTDAGYSNQTGSANSIFGAFAGKGGAGSFSSSTLMGYQSGYSLSTGNNNILLGFKAGYAVTTGSGNIVIGFNQDTQFPGANNQLNVGGVLFGDLNGKTLGINGYDSKAALTIWPSYVSGFNANSQVWNSGAGVGVATMTASGTMHAVSFVGNGAGLTGITAPGDNLGNHTASQPLNMNSREVYGVSTISVAGVYGYGTQNLDISVLPADNNPGRSVNIMAGKFGNNSFAGGGGISLLAGQGDVWSSANNHSDVFIRGGNFNAAPSTAAAAAIIVQGAFNAGGGNSSSFKGGNILLFPGASQGGGGEGYVGVGISTPAATLHVSGRVMLQDSTQGEGKVLTSDADGLAYWQTIPADNLGSHTATTALDLAGYPVVNVSSIIINGGGLAVISGTASDSNGIHISTGGEIVTRGFGNGSYMPLARGVGSVDLQTRRILGMDNVAAGAYSTIAGGESNKVAASADHAFIGAGDRNRVDAGQNGVVTGGYLNVLGGSHGFIGGGYGNTAGGGAYALVTGGKDNVAASQYSAVQGGYYNRVNDIFSEGSVIPGGSNLTITNSRYALAAGYWAAINQADGSFTWNDYHNTAGNSELVNNVPQRTVFKNRGGFMVTGSTNTAIAGDKDRGVFITGDGLLGVSTGAPKAAIDVVAAGSGDAVYSQIWRDASGVVRASMTASGKLYADIAVVGGGDDLGSHTAAQALNMAGYAINNASVITVSSLTTAAAGVTFSTNVYLMNGRLGLGITAPVAQLHLNRTEQPGTAETLARFAMESAFSSLHVANASAADGIFHPALVSNQYSDGGDGFTLTSNINNDSIVYGPLFVMNGTNAGGTAMRPLLELRNAGLRRLIVSGNGSTGIGASFPATDYPSANLHISSFAASSGQDMLKISTGPVGADVLVVKGDGSVGLGTVNPAATLDVRPSGGYAQIWRNQSGVIVASMSASGQLTPQAGGDNLGNHTATMALQMGPYAVNTSSYVSAGAFHITGTKVLAVLPGIESLAVGFGAGQVDTGNNNVFVGYTAGYSNTNGFSNTFLGRSAGYSTTSGYNNTYVGQNVGYFNTTGIMNSMLGAAAGYSNTTGSNNTFMGDYAGTYNQTGSANALFGFGAGGYGTGSANSFSSSTVVGFKAGYMLGSGSADNILVGFQAGDSLTSGSKNIIIGYDQDTTAPSSANQLNIGGVLFGDLSAKTIGISTRAPQAALDVVSTGTAAGQMAQIWRNNSGTIVSSVSATGVMMANKFVSSMGAGTGQASAIGLAGVNLNTQATAGISEETLQTYTLPANSLNENKKGIRIKAWGTALANANAKTIRLRFGGLGGTVLASQSLIVSADNWMIDAIVFRTASNTQKALGYTLNSWSVSSPAQTDTAAIDIVVSGETPASAGDVTAEGLVVEFMN